MDFRESIKNEIGAILEILAKTRDDCKVYDYYLRNLTVLISLAEKLRGE